MAVSQLPQAPYRQDRKIFPTPLVTDILFSEVRDCNRTEFPEYGTPHPNAAKWPHHKLIFIKSVDIERDGLFEFFYAADRENQDEYNFSYGYRNVIGNVGGREFRVVLREYIIPRSEFDPLYPAFQAPMPNVPEGLFEDIEYVFFDKTQKKIDQPELDSLYVAEVRTYIETAFLDYKLSYSVQVPDLVPEKFRSNIPQVVTEGIEAGLAAIPELEAGQLLASEDQLNPDIKIVKSVQQAKPAENITLSGSRSYVETTKAITEDTYSPNELEAETGLLIAQSIATPLGDGTFVRETVRVEEWPELVSTEWDETLNTQIVSKEQFVSPASVDTLAAHTSYRAVNKDRTLRTVQTPPDNALLNYRLVFPSRMDIQMPNVLKSISVVWAEDSAQGTSDGEWDGYAQGPSWSLSGSEGDTCESSASIKPELVVDIQQTWGRDIPVTVYAFFVKTNNGSVSEAEISQRIEQVAGVFVEGTPTTIKPWPIFKPVAHTLVVSGGSVNCRASAQGSAGASQGGANSSSAERGTTKGTSYSLNVDINAVPIQPTIHKQINIANDVRSISISAQAEAKWSGTNFPSLNVQSTAQHSVSGEVTPNILLATSPDSIPTLGLYVMRTSVEPYKWGWAKCSAIILDAKNLT
jgi:hypothetical protein